MVDDVQIRSLAPEDRNTWLRLRSELWNDHAIEDLEREVDGFLRGEGFEGFKGGPLPATVLLAVRNTGRIVGFAEIDLRPQADGCVTHPVGYLEGWYVTKEERRRQVGRALVSAAEDWARTHGCSEMASDTLFENTVGEQAHRALGYEEVQRTIHFHKNIR